MTDENSSGPKPAQDDSERRTWWAIIAISTLLFVAIVWLGRPLVMGRLEAARNLDRATAMIAETNDDLARIDAAVRAEPQRSSPEAGPAVRSATQELRVTFTEVETLSQQGVERLTTDEQKRAARVKAMAAARLQVLEAAGRVFPEAGVGGAPPTQEALKDYDDAFERMRQADAALVKL